ncbi:hypothetical protein B0H14DRAFT_3879451 [Mycena olivaceomarginata]|nr:hypothetical protein B0H14DRAFT_3879451 [Mycena olivaceomarginata]
MDHSLCAKRASPNPTRSNFCLRILALGVCTTPRFRGDGRLSLTSPFNAGQTLARCDVRIGCTIRAPLSGCRMPAASSPACASLSSGRNMRWSQSRSVRPLSRPPRPPRRHPACGTLLVSLDLYIIEPIGTAAELQDIGGQRGKAAVGAACLALLFFDVSPSHRSNAASSQRLRAQSLSARHPRCRTSQQRMQTGGSRAGRPPFLARSYRPLLQNRRVPHAAYGTPPIGAVFRPEFEGDDSQRPVCAREPLQNARRSGPPQDHAWLRFQVRPPPRCTLSPAVRDRVLYAPAAAAPPLREGSEG